MPEPDTNRRVAEACGWEVCDESAVPLIRDKGSEGPWSVFIPSETAADAILAAERFGLFDDKRPCYLIRDDGKWVVRQMLGEDMGSGTFCEAICSAILKLSEVTREAK